jgi:hypothetical protein
MRFSPFVLGVLIFTVSASYAAQVLIECGANCPAGPGLDISRVGIPPNRLGGASNPFQSIGGSGGAQVFNVSGTPITSLQIDITSPGDTIDPKSTGGTVFPTATIDAAGTSITLSGANIPNRGSFWIRIPRSFPYSGATIRLSGIANPPPKPAPSRSVLQNSRAKILLSTESAPRIGNDDTSFQPTIYFDGNGNITIQGWSINFADYVDGTNCRANDCGETIIGKDINIRPLKVESPLESGGFALSNTTLCIQSSDCQYTNNPIYLGSPITDVLLVPDNTVQGFDCVLYAKVSWPESADFLFSKFVDELYSPARDKKETILVFRSSLLSATENLSHNGSSVGKLAIAHAETFTGGTLTISCEPEQTFEATGPDGAIVNYQVTASDPNDLNVVLSCLPPNNTLFPIGKTTVACTALNSFGEMVNCTFNVNVVDSSAPIVTLTPLTRRLGNSKRPPKPLPGMFSITAIDLSDPSPYILIKDSKSNFVLGPLNSGVRVKFHRGGKNASSKAMKAGPVDFQVKLQGNALVIASDSSGNTSTPIEFKLGKK